MDIHISNIFNKHYFFSFGFVDCTSVSHDKIGSGPGLVWLDEVSCSGTERSLLSCPHDGLGVVNCSTYEDAGVRCTGINHIMTKCLARSQLKQYTEIDN